MSKDPETLIGLMQDAVRNYLEPITYNRRRPGGTCLHDSVVDIPAHNHSQEAISRIANQRNNMFINDIIYFLDSAEHGTNTPKLSSVSDAIEDIRNDIKQLQTQGKPIGP